MQRSNEKWIDYMRYPIAIFVPTIPCCWNNKALMQKLKLGVSWSFLLPEYIAQHQTYACSSALHQLPAYDTIINTHKNRKAMAELLLSKQRNFKTYDLLLRKSILVRLCWWYDDMMAMCCKELHNLKRFNNDDTHPAHMVFFSCLVSSPNSNKVLGTNYVLECGISWLAIPTFALLHVQLMS